MPCADLAFACDNQAALPTKSLDAPATVGGSYKDSSEDFMLGDEIDAEEVEGAEESLSARLSSRMKDDVLQHDINTVLFTLPARERNVSSALLILPMRKMPANAQEEVLDNYAAVHVLDM